jgi:hypothetical protein
MAGELFVLVVFWTILAVGVGVHAANRDRSAFLWGLVTFFTGLLGAFVYALVLASAAQSDDDASDEVRVCPSCSARHTGSPAHCPDCGDPLSDDDEATVASVLRSGSQGYCSNCKSQVDLDADACANCGSVF